MAQNIQLPTLPKCRECGADKGAIYVYQEGYVPLTEGWAGSCWHICLWCDLKRTADQPKLSDREKYEARQRAIQREFEYNNPS